ncbi:MAG: glutamate 5-kinase [Clostridia bacterium]|nr:glutamate 5-kinase [Clostridia bacterium]
MRIVVKVGTSTLAHKTGNLNIRRVEELCKVLSDIKNAGHEVVLVSSGAIGMGLGKLAIKKKPDDIPSKQAAAAVGQCELMYVYDKLFSEYNHTVGQILLTGDDVKDETRHQNFKNTIYRLLELGAIPIVNENDSVSTDEIEIGDNDTLGAIVAESVSADIVAILTDTNGLYTADPRKDKTAKLLSIIEEITDDIFNLGAGSGTKLGTGGMKTKIGAAEIAVNAGIDVYIINGERPSVLYDIIEGKKFIGTKFCAKK